MSRDRAAPAGRRVVRVQAQALDAELAALHDQVRQLQAENGRLLRLLEMTPQQARPPSPAQAGFFDTAPGAVHAGSTPAQKVGFFRALFAARTDAYAVRWENIRSGKSGWMPAVRGGWRKGVPVADREYLPLTEEIITAHLSGDVEIGLYPLMDGDRCWWLAADFDGPAAMLDALAYLKAARAAGAPAVLEVSRSGKGAHAWLFFAAPVSAATARQVGTGLLREAIALRGRMDLSSYDRLFPSQDVLQTGGLGNLIAAPLQGRCRRRVRRDRRRQRVPQCSRPGSPGGHAAVPLTGTRGADGVHRRSGGQPHRAPSPAAGAGALIRQVRQAAGELPLSPPPHPSTPSSPLPPLPVRRHCPRRFSRLPEEPGRGSARGSSAVRAKARR